MSALLASDLNLTISRFDHVWDTTPKPTSGHWEWLCELFGPARPAVHLGKKGAIPLWCPALFKPGTTKKAENVLELCCLVLDLDQDTHPDRAFQLFEGYARCVHTSFSHRRPKDTLTGPVIASRCRIVVLLATPCPASEWDRVWEWARQQALALGIVVDEACSNLDRFYSLPRVQDETQPWHHLVGGFEPLDWRTIPVEPEAARPLPSARAVPPEGRQAQPPAGDRKHQADLVWYRAALANTATIPSQPTGKRKTLLGAGRNLAGCLHLLPEESEAHLRSVLEAAARGCGAVNPSAARQYLQAVDDGIARGLLEPHPRVPRIDRPMPERPQTEGPLGYSDDPGPGEDSSGATSTIDPGHRPHPPTPSWGEPLQLTRAQLRGEGLPPERWLLRWPNGRGCLPLGTVGILAAKGGIGKTRSMLELAVSVASGGQWLAPSWGTTEVRARGTGFQVAEDARGGRVLLLLGEEQAYRLPRKMHFACKDLGINAAGREDEVLERVVIYPLAAHWDLALTRPALMRGGSTQPHVENLAALRQVLAQHGPFTLIVLDPLSAFGSPDTEKDNEAATKLFSVLSQLTEDGKGPTVLVVHHSGQDAIRDSTLDETAVRGVTGLTNRARWVGVLGYPKDCDQPRFVVPKNNDACKGGVWLDSNEVGRLFVAEAPDGWLEDGNKTPRAKAPKKPEQSHGRATSDEDIA